MNKRLPYEEELSKQLNDLQLPDEDVSWKDMERRLNDDSDDGVIIPPVKRGCLGYSLLLILLAIVIWLIVKPGKWPWNKDEKNIVSSEKVHNNKKDTTGNIRIKDVQKNPKHGTVKDFDHVNDTSKKQPTKDSLKTNNKKDPAEKNYSQRDVTINEYGKTGKTRKNKPLKEGIPGNYIKKKKKIQKINKTAGSLNSKIQGKQNSDSSETYEKNITGDESIIVHDPIDPDSIATITPDSNAIKKKIKDANIPGKAAKQDSIVKRPIYFAAGLALNQQLPVSGQKFVPYNSLGRKSTLADYIPSVYFRMYKDQKWFLQSEFRYGAPQFTKEILYVQKKVVDTFTNTTMSTSNRLKKTYYHQLPVSFNYFILPHFSVGLGFIWNKYSSAVSELEIKETNNITQIDSIQVKTIFHSKKADSNFVKSYFQALAETQYQWKRWSFGARYSFGLQPYIRFQLPGGEHREEKNSSLQIFLRYDLWESGKK
jgi:hypothetical protein